MKKQPKTNILLPEVAVAVVFCVGFMAGALIIGSLPMMTVAIIVAVVMLWILNAYDPAIRSMTYPNYVAPLIEKLSRDHRKEAVAFGLIAAGLDTCHGIATDGGFKYPAQIAGHLADDILQHFQAIAAEDESRRLAAGD